MIRLVLVAALLAVVGATTVRAEPHGAVTVPFVATLSNTAPLHFGLTAEQTAAALGAPLAYVSGRPGHEIFVAQTTGGNFFPRHEAIFLQFRNGRLTGWTADRRTAAAWW